MRKIAQTYANLKTRYNVNVLLLLLLWCHVLWILIPPFMDFKTGGFSTKPHQSDFMSFWTAARFAWEGSPLKAYNPALLKEAQATLLGYNDPNGMLDWLLPPPAFFLFMPFALISYTVARFLWIIITLLAYGVTAWRIAPRKTAFLASLAAPAIAYNCIFSQTGALTAALLGAVILNINQRQVLAGICAGLLIFKPQLGMLIPFAFIAGAYWRAFLSATITVFVLIGLSIICFSQDVWIAFFEALNRTVHINLISKTASHGIMQTFYSLVQQMTGNITLATIGQLIISLLALISVIIVWKGAYSRDLKGAVLIVAIAVSTAYFQIYEFPMVIIASLFLTNMGHKSGFFPYEVDLMVLAAFIPYFYMASPYPLGLISIIIMIFLVSRRFAQEKAIMIH